MRGRWLAIVIGVLVAAACASPSATPGTSGDTASAAPSASAAGSRKPELRVSVTDATYGSIALLTSGGARCRATLDIPLGFYGEPPGTSLAPQTAPASGIVRWSYAAPRVPAATANYDVTCESGNASGSAAGSFPIASPPLRPTGFKVHVTTSLPPRETINTDASLVPLRDADAAKMLATLATEWRGATRGLGSLTLVDDSPDITIYVIAAKGTSVHRSQPRDGSEDILIYASDRLGPKSVENSVATALHELGHIWCCSGPGTYPPGTEQQGHWLTNERSPGLYGADKYGLMTDPVTCTNFGTFLSCPNRFSDREMTALGYTSFPPPTLDPCVQQALALDGSIRALKAELSTQELTLTSIDSQLSAIRAQYPARNYPSSVLAKYNSLVDQYNAMIGPYNQNLSSYNAQVKQYNALPCDAS